MGYLALLGLMMMCPGKTNAVAAAIVTAHLFDEMLTASAAAAAAAAAAAWSAAV
jgi:hypothetical protein